MAQITLKGIVSLLVAFMCGSAQGTAAGVELVEVPAGTLLSVELVDRVDTGANKSGDVFRARLQEGVWVKNREVLNPGVTVRGVLKEVESSGRVKKRAKLELTLQSLQVDASTVPVQTDTLTYLGDKHAGKNAGSLLGGALQGAIMGLLFGGKVGAGVGAAAGGGLGAVTGVIKGKQDVVFEQGARLLFETLEPVKVPVYPAPKTPKALEEPKAPPVQAPVKETEGTRPTS
jgi:hypothetical protein